MITEGLTWSVVEHTQWPLVAGPHNILELLLRHHQVRHMEDTTQGRKLLGMMILQHTRHLRINTQGQTFGFLYFIFFYIFIDLQCQDYHQYLSSSHPSAASGGSSSSLVIYEAVR